jgi:SAM-dependent methyltransferase
MTNPQSVDLTAFRAWEHDAWQNSAVAYHYYHGELSLQAIEPLLDAVGVRKGTRLLDVATGPGYAADAAAQRGANAIGVDFSTAMVTAARNHYPQVEFQEGDAEALSFPDNSFDAVVSNFGILHFALPERALREAHRVLTSEGRVGFTTRAKPEDVIPSMIVQGAVATYGDMNVSLPPRPSPFRFSDLDECRRVLLEIGFINPQVTQVPQVWRLPLRDGLFDAFYEATPRLGAILRAQTPEALNAIRQAVREATKDYEKGDWLELPTFAILSSATKP